MLSESLSVGDTERDPFRSMGVEPPQLATGSPPVSQCPSPYLDIVRTYCYKSPYIVTDKAVLILQEDLPLYVQVRDYIERLITAGEVSRGERLPTESELQDMFGVSRSTVRQALGDLENAGLVTRRRGVGTIVGGTIRPDIMRLTSFTEDMVDRGLSTSSLLLDMSLVFPPSHVAELLGLDPGQERLWFLKRLRCANTEPVALHYLYVPPDLAFAPRDLEAMDSYYALLDQKLGLQAMTADETLRARICSEDEAAELGCDPGAAVLEFERVTYGDAHRPVEYVRGVYRSDRYEYKLTLYRNREI